MGVRDLTSEWGVRHPAARADEPRPLDRAELDRRAWKVANDAVAVGADLYNRGNHEGCYRLYQGAVIALLPQLDHRPKLAELVSCGAPRKTSPKCTASMFIASRSHGCCNVRQ